jgi:hypothetical protein
VVDEQAWVALENSDSILETEKIKNKNLEPLASSTGGAWSNLFIRSELKYFFMIGGTLILFLLGYLLYNP